MWLPLCFCASGQYSSHECQISNENAFIQQNRQIMFSILLALNDL